MKRSNLSQATVSSTRGVGTSAPAIRPVSQAIVIGVGGSGIQTVSRVKSMVEGQFPEAVARSSLRFLGVDSVGIASQHPALPSGVDLAPDEYHNLTTTPFDASVLVKREAGYDSPLHGWWDFSRRVPTGPLDSGLKQDRMLGRLAFYREGAKLQQAIASAFRQSVQITAERVQQGEAGSTMGGTRPRVYLVSSVCGGTGSSGFLEVVYRLWAASQQFGLAPDIRAFLYLPGVFEEEIRKTSPNAIAELANVRANAYGFLRELDHFLAHGDTLARQVAAPDLGVGVDIPADDLLKQVFVVDSQLSHGQFVNEITDAYEVTASAIYQLLMTQVGVQTATNGTNVDVLLNDVDGHGKRRIYCGLSVASITYPGETLRRHLTHRFADWVVRDRLLANSGDLSERVRKHPATLRLSDSLIGLHSRAVTFELEDVVRDYQRTCLTAPETLVAEDADETVTKVVVAARDGRARALEALRRQYAVYGATAIAEVDSVVVDAALEVGQGIPFLTQMVKHAVARLVAERDEAKGRKASHQDAIKRGADEIDAAERVLSGVRGWQGWLGRRDAAAKELGQAVRAFGKATLEQAAAEASEDFYAAAAARLLRLQSELERAEARLADQSRFFAAAWHADDLVGKDAGARSLTSLIPSDVQPEVEDSLFARDAWARVRAAVEALDSEELLAGLYRAWRSSGGRAAFDLGSNSNDRATSASASLNDQLALLADRYAHQFDVPVETVEGEDNRQNLHLPRSLEDAADKFDGGESLDRALISASALGAQVLLPIDFTKLRSGLQPSPATLVSRPASLAARVDRFLPVVKGRTVLDWPDEERIQVLTTMWGASAHSLTSLATWRPYYEEALRSDLQGLRRPPHLSRAWSEDLTPLEPLYEDLAMAADAVVPALLVGRLLSDPVVEEAVFGRNALADSKGVPLVTEDLGVRVAWRATTFGYDPALRVWQARPQQFDFGASLADLLSAVAANPLFRQSTEEFAGAVVGLAGRAAALVALRGLADRFTEAREKSADVPEERHAAGLLRQEALELLGQYERSNVAMSF